MRFFVFLLLLLVPLCSISQDRDLEQTRKQLEISSNQATGVNRLKLLDSLANLMRYDTPINVDSIFRVTISYAQKLDSTDIAIKHATNLINYINYTSRNFDEAKQIIDSTSLLVPQVIKPNLIDEFYYEAADVYYNSGNFEACIKYYDSAYIYAKKYKSEYTGLSKLGKGYAQVENGQFGEASLNLQEAAIIFQKKKDTLNWLNSKNSISILYSKNGFYKEAKKERKELIELAQINNSFPNLPLIYYNNAADDNKNGLQLSRIQNLKSAIESNITSQNKAFLEPVFITGLAAAYAENDSLILAKNLIKELEQETDKITGFYEPFYISAKMRLAYAMKDYKNAEAYGSTYLDLKNKGEQYEEIQEAELFLSKVYESIGEKDKALSHFKKYTTIKDSIGSSQKTRVLAYYQTLYETEKRDLTIKNQNSNIALLDSNNKIKGQWLLFGSLGLVSFFGFITIYRSRNYAKKQQKLQEVFTQDIIKTQENERTRLALELHDSVGQQLMLLTRKSKTINDASFENLANNTLTNLRSISQGLYPVALERLGFTAAIEDLVNDLDENTDVFFSMEIENMDQDINKNKALHLYRIVQEALNNTIKHAEARAVFVGLNKQSNMISLTIKDNGKGFDYIKKLETSKSLGMKSLLERCKIINANLKITSEINKGTEIIVKIPVTAS